MSEQKMRVYGRNWIGDGLWEWEELPYDRVVCSYGDAGISGIEIRPSREGGYDIVSRDGTLGIYPRSTNVCNVRDIPYGGDSNE